jgi:hypothetical protein
MRHQVPRSSGFAARWDVKPWRAVFRLTFFALLQWNTADRITRLGFALRTAPWQPLSLASTICPGCSEVFGPRPDQLGLD